MSIYTELDTKHIAVKVQYVLRWTMITETFNEIIQDISDWDEEDIGSDKKQVANFLKDVSTWRAKTNFDPWNFDELNISVKCAILNEIKNVFEEDVLENEADKNIFDENIIYEGISRWIEETYKFDPRCG